MYQFPLYFQILAMLYRLVMPRFHYSSYYLLFIFFLPTRSSVVWDVTQYKKCCLSVSLST